MAVVVAVDVKVRRKEGKTRAELRIDRAAANIASLVWLRFTRGRAGARLPTPGRKWRVFDPRLTGFPSSQSSDSRDITFMTASTVSRQTSHVYRQRSSSDATADYSLRIICGPKIIILVVALTPSQ